MPPRNGKSASRKVAIRRWLRGTACPPLMAKNTGYAGPIDRLAGMTFFAPGFHAGLDDTYVVAGHPECGGECLQSVKVFHAVTPATRHETNCFLALGGTSEAQVEALKIALPPVFDEDSFATVEIEKILTRCETLLSELMLKCDGTAVESRRLLQRMMDAERALA